MREDAENTAMRVGLALAVDICPGCAHTDRSVSPRNYCRGLKPCPAFHPDNFYYDTQEHHFRCYNWMDGKGNDKSTAVKTSPEHTA